MFRQNEIKDTSTDIRHVKVRQKFSKYMNEYLSFEIMVSIHMKFNLGMKILLYIY